MRTRKGFTLVEIVVASIILSGSVLALGAVSTRCLISTRLNRQYETAAALADKQLRMIDYMGIEVFVESGQTQGRFEEFEPEYSWEVSTEYREIDSLYFVNITVNWVERNRPREISIDTMLNGTSALIEEEEQE